MLGMKKNYDLHMYTSQITGYKKGLDNNCSRGSKSRADKNRQETHSYRGTNSRVAHSILEIILG